MQTVLQESIGFNGIQQLPNQPENSWNPRQLLEKWWSKRMDGCGYCQVRAPKHGADQDSTEIGLVLPGSFNPLHRGHSRMAEIAQEMTGMACHFELSIANVDKPDLGLDDAVSRCKQPFGPCGLIVSGAAKFTEKSELYPNTTFVVGADTIVRLCDSRYHNSSRQELDRAIDKFEARGCRFMVFGRMLSNKFVDSENIHINERLKALCKFVDRERFEINLSSSELRRSGTR